MAKCGWPAVPRKFVKRVMSARNLIAAVYYCVVLLFTVPSGLLTALPAASAATANMLEHLHKQQQHHHHHQHRGQSSRRVQRQDDSFNQVLDLAAQQLSLLTALINVWPAGSRHRSCLSSSSELGVVGLSALQLAPLVLDASGGRAAYISIVLRHTQVLYECLRGEVQDQRENQTSTAALTVAGDAGDSSSSSSRTNAATNCPESISPAVQQLLQSAQLLKLLAATQALYAQVLQRACLDGGSNVNSSSSSSTAAVTASGSASAATADVLRATSLSWTHSDAALFAEDLEVSSADQSGGGGGGGSGGGGSGGGGRRSDLPFVAVIEAALVDTAVVMQYVLAKQAAAHTDHVITSSSSSSSSSSASGCSPQGACSSSSSSDVVDSSVQTTAAGGPDQQQQEQQQQQLRKRELLQQLLQPWAVVQLEILQLATTMDCQLSALDALYATFMAAKQLDAAVYAMLKCSLLQVLLHLLTQCMQDPPASSSRASDSSSSTSSSGGGGDAGAIIIKCSKWQEPDVAWNMCMMLYTLLAGMLHCCA
jgi:hypothetical protein